MKSSSNAAVAVRAALMPAPDAIDDEIAACLMMQGITASHVAIEFYAIKPYEVATTFMSFSDFRIVTNPSRTTG